MVSPTCEKEAVAAFQMISPKEADIRVKVGTSLLLATLLGYPTYVTLFQQQLATTFSIPCGLLAFLVGAGVTVYRTGKESQWGCILNGKWNPDGKGPKSFSNNDFVRRKRNQFLKNVVQSTILSIVVAVGLQTAARTYTSGIVSTETITEDLVSSVVWSVGGLVLTLVLSFLA